MVGTGRARRLGAVASGKASVWTETSGCGTVTVGCSYSTWVWVGVEGDSRKEKVMEVRGGAAREYGKGAQSLTALRSTVCGRRAREALPPSRK
ncbi:hypothetical protein PAHAL_J033900 [Panicum hallii]|uniref:Uncharacterized protein n=1 Tax=Panicum hallii TaxID=206008 RepID=A0A2T7AA44_9POAL|nr:hypothetical protein PAHAL_J033900 [Panicum hallii]